MGAIACHNSGETEEVIYFLTLILLYCSLAAKNLNCHPTLIIETLDGAILSISSATQEEVFEWFIAQSLFRLGLDSTLQNSQKRKQSTLSKNIEAYTIQDGVHICVCDFARLLIFYYYGQNWTIR